MLNTNWTEVEVIELLVDSAASLGFGMCGSKSTGTVVRHIHAGGAAEMDGRLRLGDHIVCVQDFNVRGFGPDQVATVLRHTISAKLLATGLNPEEDGSGAEEGSTVFRRLNSDSSPEKAVSNDVGELTLTEKSIPSVPVRLIVARSALADPNDLSDIYIEQQRRMAEQQVMDAIGIVPTEQLDEYLEALLNTRLSSQPLTEENQPAEPAVSLTHTGPLSEHGELSDEELYPRELSSISTSVAAWEVAQTGRGWPTKENNESTSEEEPVSTAYLPIEKSDLGTLDQPNSYDELMSKLHCPSSPMLARENAEDRKENIASILPSKKTPGLASTDFEQLSVILERPKDEDLGLTVVGYVYRDPAKGGEYTSGIFIQSLATNSVADKCGRIWRNDQIIQVNNEKLLGLENLTAVSILKTAGSPITLHLRRHKHGFLFEHLRKAAINVCPRLINTYQKYKSNSAALPMHLRQTDTLLTVFSRDVNFIESPMIVELTDCLEHPSTCNQMSSAVEPPVLGPEETLPNLDRIKDFDSRTDNHNAHDFATVEPFDMQYIDKRRKTVPSLSYFLDFPAGEEVDFCNFPTRIDCNSLLRKQTSQSSSGGITSTSNRVISGRITDPSIVYAGEVTPELEELMRNVWQPLIGPDCDVIVLHIKKPKSASSLGISVEGVDWVRKRGNFPLANGELTEPVSAEPRHFVQSIIPDGLLGSLNIIQPGDELLQVNGRRLRGMSRTSTVRCLRNLPSHIELVLSRARQPTQMFAPEELALLEAHGEEPPLEVMASEVNSVDTTYSDVHLPANSTTVLHNVTGHPPTNVSPRAIESRISEWVRRSVVDLQHSSAVTNSHDLEHPQSHKMESSYFKPPGNAPYPPESHSATLNERRSYLESFRHLHHSPQKRPTDTSHPATMPRVRSGTYRVQDPRYKAKRPVWSSVPLLVQLTKSERGFGFSLSEYEELPVSETESRRRRISLTLGRRHSNRHSPFSSPRKFHRSATLPRMAFSSSRKGCILLVDGVVPNGVAHQDGRISIGDRLLFINDRNLSKATLQDAVRALKSAPNGPCLLGISKMHLVPNVVEEPNVDMFGNSRVQIPPSEPAMSTTFTGYEPLYVNTGEQAVDDGQASFSVPDCGLVPSQKSTSLLTVAAEQPSVALTRSQSCGPICLGAPLISCMTWSSRPWDLCERVILGDYRPCSPTPRRMQVDGVTTVNGSISQLSVLAADLVTEVVESAIAFLEPSYSAHPSSDEESLEMNWTHSCSSTSISDEDRFAKAKEPAIHQTALYDAAEQLVDQILQIALEQIVRSAYSPTLVPAVRTLNEPDKLEVHSLSIENQSRSYSLVDDAVAVFSSTMDVDSDQSFCTDGPSGTAADIDLSTTSTVSLSSYFRSGILSSETESSSTRPNSPRSLRSCCWPVVREFTPDPNVPDRWVLTTSVHRRSLNRRRLERRNKRTVQSLPLESFLSSSSGDCLDVLDDLRDDVVMPDIEYSDLKASFPMECSKDHPLNFHVLPEDYQLSDLHDPYLDVPPVEKSQEKFTQIVLLSAPIGIKLDALAARGQDGCRIVQIFDGGAVCRSNVLQPNDYITELDGHSMRHVTNLEAFQLLRQSSSRDGTVDFVLDSEKNGRAESYTEPFGFIEQVIISRNADETSWGLNLAGEEYLPALPENVKAHLFNPTCVQSIKPDSPAERCGCLQPGDIILKIADKDVVHAGPAYVRHLLQDFLNQGATQVSLGVRFSTVAPTSEEVNSKSTTVAEVERRSSLADRSHVLAPGDRRFSKGINELDREDSPSSFSQVEAPEPLSEMDSRDELNVLSRSIESPVHRIGTIADCGNGQQDDDDIVPLSLLACPVLPDESVASESLTVKSADKSMTDMNGTVNAFRVGAGFPPPPPTRRFSRETAPFSVEDSISNLPVITKDPVSLYERDEPAGDKVIPVQIELPWPLVNGSGDVPSPKFESLGIHLVGSIDPNLNATYVAGLTPGSVAAQSGTLQIGDEVVQVGQNSVVDLGRLMVGRCITRAVYQSIKRAAAEQDPITPTVFLVVRRNPNNMKLMACITSPDHPIPKHPFDLTNGVSLDERTQGSFHPGSGDESELLTPALSTIPLTSTVNHLPVSQDLLVQVHALLDESPDLYDIFDTEIQRNSNGYGIFIVNYGPQDKPGVFVSDLAPNGAAAQHGELCPNDRILAVNGQIQTDYDSTLSLMKQSTTRVRLTIARRKPATQSPSQAVTKPVATSSPAPSASVTNTPLERPKPPPIVPGRETLVELTRHSGSSWGFSVVGGKDTVLGGILVHAVHDDGIVAEDGRIAVGDRLLAVNGVDLRDADHETGKKIIRNAGDSLRLLIYREPPTCLEETEQPQEIEVTIVRKPGESLGLSLFGRSPYSTGTAIAAIVPGTPAAQCGLLKPGDVVLEINGLDYRLAQYQEVAAAFKASPEEVLETGGNLIVEDILPGSPAALSIMIQPGDRLLTVDREPVDWLRPDEVFNLLSGLTECTLELGRLPVAPYPVDPGLSTACFPQDEQPPYPCSVELPEIFDAEMPNIEPPPGVRSMDTLEEEKPRINANPVELSIAKKTRLSSSSSSITSTDEAGQTAQRSAAGFQVRQVCLPPALPGSTLGIRLAKAHGISGPVIVRIMPDSVASQTLLRVGDRILGLDDKLLLLLDSDTTPRQLLARIKETWLARGSSLENPVRLTVVGASDHQTQNGDASSESENDRAPATSTLNDGFPAEAANPRSLLKTNGPLPASRNPPNSQSYPTLHGLVVYGREEDEGTLDLPGAAPTTYTGIKRTSLS
ncbi:hypothetical protein CRM22_007830 [Opisthorchis felineus]|uniref:PDZ domain-containing protein n=1 Tax=Opisthorchis felineus TaxID=147828 RepID=A0A4S2LE31_OPIFE|nr:hypothetical protein CRM22_007830 [Opisthorchis felineus]